MTRQYSVRALSLLVLGLWFCDAARAAGQQTQNAGAPETFSARAQAENKAGAAVSAPIVIHVERFTPDFDRTTVQEALRVGGYPGFLTALRKAPNVGYVELAAGKRSFGGRGRFHPTPAARSSSSPKDRWRFSPGRRTPSRVPATRWR